MITVNEAREAYIYSLWNGRFMMYHGIVRTFDHASVFGNKHKRLTCSGEPGVVHNATVWFPERNDELAQKTLLEYNESCVAVLEEKIKNHFAKIKIINGGVEEEDE